MLFSPSGTAAPYYAEFGWVPAAGSTARVPDRNTDWQQESTGALTPTSPVMLKYDNGEGLTFRRTISVDDRYLFTIKDDVSQCRQRAGDALSLRADLAPRRAAGLRLLHPA